MKCIALILALLSAVSGGFAAYRWYVASQVNIVPFEMHNGQVREVPTDDVQTWISALKGTIQKSGRLNKVAALWTAGSVVCAGLSTLFGAWQ
jgi:hypothetical protein